MVRNSISFIFLLSFFRVFSQDPIFTNVNQSLVYLNPSFAGSNGYIRDQFTYRNQWPNLSGNCLTYNNSFDAYIKPIKAGIALNYSLDDLARGTLKTNTISFSYAQYFYFLDKKLKIIPSVQMGYFIKQLDKDKLYFGNSINSRNGFVYWTAGEPASKKSNIDFSTGLLMNYKGFYFGASVFHVNQPDEGLMGISKLPYRLNIHSSYNRKINEDITINFASQLYHQQSYDVLKLQVNSLIKKHLVVSGGLSSNDAFMVGLGYKRSLFAVSLAYDASYSKLSGNTAGSWELLASFNLRTKENRKLITDFETW